jgi:type IV pilus assembly protein PilB
MAQPGRLTCSHCRRPVRSRTKLLSREWTPRWRNAPVLKGPAASSAAAGLQGRTAICELLDLSDRIREMILARRPASEVKKAAHEEGMRFLRESAIEKVLKGMTTLREINKVTFVE